MKDELDDALCRDFPLLYRARYDRMETTCMCWGFCCGDGWEPLIRKLSEKLEPLVQAIPEEERPVVIQVKEKFGGLRFYMTTETEEMSKAIEEAEVVSFRTCEECGQPGSLTGNSWVVTLCEECRKTK